MLGLKSSYVIIEKIIMLFINTILALGCSIILVLSTNVLIRDIAEKFLYTELLSKFKIDFGFVFNNQIGILFILYFCFIAIVSIFLIVIIKKSRKKSLTIFREEMEK